MVLRQLLERPQRAALELHEVFAFAGTLKLCARADALLCQQGTESQGNENLQEDEPALARASDTPAPACG